MFLTSTAWPTEANKSKAIFVCINTDFLNENHQDNAIRMWDIAIS